MEKAKVYFTDFRCKVGTNNLMKLQKLCKKAGIETINFEGKFVAIKMHFGELGCLASIRPQYVKAVADLVKELGGKPFLTDCNTLYPGSRKHALEHLDCANLNGYNTITTGCQIIIGDGLVQTKWKFLLKTVNMYRRLKLAGLLWMLTCLSAWRTSKAMK